MLAYRNFKMENIVLQLINTKENEELLRNVPHREFHDLSVVYRNVFSMNKNAMECVLIDNAIMEAVGITEEKLYSLAYHNTRRKLPLMKLPLSQALPVGYIYTQEDDLWIISNEYLWYGAVALLYEDVLHDMSEVIKDNLYILPSSVNEILAIAAKNGESKALKGIVSDVNTYMVEKSKRLSNNVYFYDRDSHKVSIA